MRLCATLTAALRVSEALVSVAAWASVCLSASKSQSVSRLALQSPLPLL